MKVTFKDVGQGDSIIVEWERSGKNKIGIIDCNKKGKINPVLEHLKNTEIEEIDFIILSHPHADHFSGMIDIFNYAECRDIKIKKFAHTLFLLGKDFYRYLNWVEIDTAALEDLQRLVQKLDVLHKSGIILKISPIIEGWREDLATDIYLKCLSPSHDEAKTYMDIVSGEPEKNKKAASSGANYLSTLFCLVKNDNYFLLTSDSEPLTFERLLQEKSHTELLEKSLYIGQMPHHGAFKNYHKPFWDHVIKNDERHAVASAGENAKYKHPHFEVLNNFYNDGYRIHCTSLYHGSKEFLDYLVELGKVSSQLDTFSTLVHSYTAGDKVFQ
ncbi:MBL fold metallo-hydrolase [Elizabethkingia ursingii]|uniref:ComEC/Rec2 family competence protein n=1 Tax=Elizabethkingia ursingii TaxID=1756150 RepID=UPI0020110B38|nr:MBL fold metallo-hydrolase [Elizabethkingia ursingii]MCL1666623.1 MBL fold metallo-hydrolase [Elizabethkingia ursingii]